VAWPAGIHTNPGVWVSIFLLLTLIVNLLPVHYYGRVEYIFGCIKITFLVGLIMINICLNIRQRFHDSRFWTYEQPWGFASQNITIRAGVEGQGDLVYEGTTGRFLAFWTCMITSFFSLMGWDVILITAPENRDLQKSETIKISTRKIALRVIVLYALAVFSVGLNVPYTDRLILNYSINGVGGGRSSSFVLAAIRERVPALPHLLNGFFIFSAFATGANSLYAASRILHAIASLRDAWPRWGWVEAVRSRLERTRVGVPMNAVLLSWLIGFLAFLSTENEASIVSKTLDEVLPLGTLHIRAVSNTTPPEDTWENYRHVFRVIANCLCCQLHYLSEILQRVSVSLLILRLQ
jgi:yeast amino acid transporter